MSDALTPTAEQLRAAGDVCKKCRAAILWATTPSGKGIPIDLEPVFGGNVELVPDPTGMLKAITQRPEGHVELYVAHFVSCPNAAEFRKDVPAPADQVPTHEQQLERKKAAGRVVMSFGKYSGEYLDDIAHSSRGYAYLEWLHGEGIRNAKLKSAVAIILGVEQ